jgi:hypothetical protein
MRFILTDRSEDANDLLFSGAALEMFLPTKEKGRRAVHGQCEGL